MVLFLTQIACGCLLLDDTVGDSLSVAQMVYLSRGDRLVQVGCTMPPVFALDGRGFPVVSGRRDGDQCFVFTSCDCQTSRSMATVGSLHATEERGLFLGRLGSVGIHDEGHWKGYRMRDADLFALTRGYQMPLVVHVLRNGSVVSVVSL